jgi:hypothetical protein
MQFLTPGDNGGLAARYGDDVEHVLLSIVDYMADAPVVLAAPSAPDTTSGHNIGVRFHCDGKWIWTDDAVLAVRERHVEVPVEFAERVLESGGSPKGLLQTQVQDALDEIERYASS